MNRKLIGVALGLAILISLLTANLASAQGPYWGYPYGYPYYGYPYYGYPQYVSNVPYRYPDLTTGSYPYTLPSLAGGYYGGTRGGFYSGPYYCYHEPYRGVGIDVYHYAGGNYFYQGYRYSGYPELTGYYFQGPR
ncbi:MAG: hypothetical protein ACUVSF_11145 [Anaerolineae bacterium]